MARINIDDDVESHDEFWKLLELIGDRDAALGKLVRFFRVAQKAYGEERPMDRDEIEAKGLGCMIDSGWAVETRGGYRAKGEKERFAWYRQKIEAGKKGGRPPRPNGDNSGDSPDNQPKPAATSENRDEPGANRPVTSANRDEPSGNRDEPHENPPALAPVPAPALVPAPAFETAHSHTRAGPGLKPLVVHPLTPETVQECVEAWRGTLRHYDSGRTVLAHEHEQIARAIQRYGPKAVLLALEGARFEPKDERFDPAKFLSLNRILPDEHFTRFLNLGVQARHKQETVA